MATNIKEKGEYVEDFTPKTANRKINKTMIIVVVIVILLAGIGIAGYSIYGIISITWGKQETKRMLPKMKNCG